MDGTLYRPEDVNQVAADEHRPSMVRLLLVTVVAAAVVVGMLLVLNWCGASVAVPDEFPNIRMPPI